MTGRSTNEFRYACKEYLSSLSLGKLRSYGRQIGVAKPTEKKKGELIELIVGVLTEEVAPIPVSSRGAPVKDDFVDPKIPEQIEKLRMTYLSGHMENARETADSFDFAARLKRLQEQEKVVLTVEDPNAEELEKSGVKEIYKGQLETLGGVSMLLPLNCIDSDNKIIISVDMIRSYDLREGDVITCYAEKRHSVLVATTVLTVNELVADTFHRCRFDDCNACYPHKRVNFYDGKSFSSVASKYLQWLIPLGKGQRGLTVSSPKSGKSTLLLQMARAAKKLNGSMKVFVLLVDQSPENVGQFRKYIDTDDLVYTTYEDEPERQVFVSEFILKRAKRYAECGNDVLLIVDSFNALAHAYNDTEASVGGKVLAGGMESKTVQYLKRYFGTARCLERGGSITMLGALASETGNPADDLLRAELSAIGNLEIYLSDDLAKRRVYPAIDLMNTQGKRSGALLDTREEMFDVFLRSEYLPVFGAEELLRLISETDSYEDLEERAYKQIKNRKK